MSPPARDGAAGSGPVRSARWLRPWLLGSGLVVALVAIVAMAQAAAALSSAETAVANGVAATRGSAIPLSDGLSSVARQHSADMASRHSLYHNPNLVSQVSAVVPGWTGIGENVGVGPSVDQVNRAFASSAEHL